MARPRRRHAAKVSRKQSNKKKISINASILSDKWDKSKTLMENYKNLGLVGFIGGKSGGMGNEFQEREAEREYVQNLKNNVVWMDINDKQEKVELPWSPVEGTVIVDARVTRIGSKINLKRSKESDLPVELTETAKALRQEMEKEASQKVSILHFQSDQELMVFEKLMEKHGEDFEAMARDIKLNKYQLSAGQLKRKFKKASLE